MLNEISREKLGFFELVKEELLDENERVESIYLILKTSEDQYDLISWLVLSENIEGIGYVYQALIEKILKDNRPDIYINLWEAYTNNRKEGLAYDIDMFTYSLIGKDWESEQELRELAELFNKLLTKNQVELLKNDKLITERINLLKEYE